MFENNYPEHIYLHWPFCTSKCIYCDFISFQDHADFQIQYHRALCKEIESWSKSNTLPPKPLQTIFIGGGTPSLYPIDLMEELFTTLKNNIDCSKLSEVTIECNPSDITEEKLDAWHSLGINRISIGIQILDDRTLGLLNRHQTVNDAQRALAIVPKYFSNISVDLIIGLPGVSQATWDATLATVLAWPLKHLSVYALTVYEKTTLYFSVQQNNLSLLSDEAMADAYLNSVQKLEANNFIQYELSNFCHPGYESVHNIAYWDRKPYRGFGLNAASFDGTSRTTNHANLSNYIAAMEHSTPETFYASIETLTPEQVQMETLMLALRQKKGMDLQSVVYLTKHADRERIMANVAQLEEAGLIVINGGSVRLTPKGMVLENEVVLKLI